MLRNMSCCGVLEYDGVEGKAPERILLEISNNWWGNANEARSAFIIFTDVVWDEYGENLHSYIVKNKLGAVVKTRKKENPNTDNEIKVWVWSPNEVNFKRWCKKNGSTIFK